MTPPKLSHSKHIAAPGDAAGSSPEPADPTLAKALEEYLAERDAGRTPNRREFLKRFPDIAAELAACLDGPDFIQDLAP